MARGLRWRGAAALLLLVFTASRAWLVASSYDAVANWEEPAFLYAAVDLRERGVAHLFDHQDDLSHGGSVPLALVATGWVAAFGPRLDVLKGVAVAWSSLTLLAILLVGARFVSPRYGLLVAAMYAGVSASLAALQVTLVGSHPEAVLFCVLALGAYWRTLDDDARASASFFLGLSAGLALWCSYFSVMWVLPLLAFHAVRRPAALPAAMAGALLGLSPWLVQNVYLRPHGATQWLARAAYHRATAAAGEPSLVVRAVESFGLGPVAGVVVVCALLAAGAWASVRAAGARRTLRAEAVLPLACSVALGVALLAVVRPQAVPTEGYYYARFFVLLQVASFFLAAFALETLSARARTAGFVAASSAVLLLWWLGQRPLYAGANTYVADRERDLAAGCAVFGHAEVDRSASFERAAQRLAEIAAPACRSAAFAGYGWGVVSRYARDGDVATLGTAMDAIVEAPARAAACAQARRLMDTIYEGAMSSDRRRTGALYLEASCRAAGASGAAAR